MLLINFSKLVKFGLSLTTLNITYSYMLDLLKKMMTPGETPNFSEMVENGAKIIDVRTVGEFQSGHINGAKNIPLQELRTKLNQLKKDETYILCCASGARSGSATRILKNEGFENVYNGGGWMMLQGQLY